METKIIDNYKLYGKCISLSNQKIEAIVTLDVGPRIISFSFLGGTNIMLSDRDKFEPMGGEKFDNHYYKGAKWENLGGHRLWVSPESLPETYYPDTDPVDYHINGNTAVFTPKPQTENGIAMSIELTLEDNSSEMKVLHKIKNISDTPKQFAAWALTVMDRGGVEIIPQNTRDTGLLGNRLIAVWPYADINDERFYLGNKYATLKQNPHNTRAFKIGFDCNSGIGYYVINDVVFSKKYEHNINGVYPDGGVSYETYTNETILEFETLGELKKVEPQETVEHKEIFALYKKPCDFNPKDEESIEKFISELK